MEQSNYSVGLDIGTTKIVAIIGKENEYGKIEVLGIGRSKSLGVHRGVVNNITQTIKSIQQAVEQAEADSGLKIGSVVVGIAGQHIRSLQHSDYITRANSEEVINEDDLDKLCNQVYKLVMLPGEEIIHVLPQEYKVDGQAEIKQPIGMYGGRLEANFHVVVGQVSSIKNIGRCIKSAGLDLGNITLEPLASSDAVLSQEEKEAGVALIDIGGGTTDLAIFRDGIIRHTAVIPFGGNVITNILLGQEDTPENVVKLCQDYGFETFINSLPQSYATILGEEGINLSGGQKQVIALMRVLYKKPKVLLLDEFTSAMDRKTEQFVLKLLNSLKPKLTIVFISHRLHSLPKIADRIYVLENGIISDFGNHEKLMKSENFYSEFWTEL